MTRIGEITSNEGETPLYACRACLQELLTIHERSVGRMDGRPRIIQIPRAPRGAVPN
ncbi:hypothetical protein ACFV2H_52560 [Streptomyces sp. NPDC059629]|uniref:hypothetical protein n=1 Tax=Streptomyces sp. NPDC059629 TaxID=3346889 RepID=UPI0036BEF6C8